MINTSKELYDLLNLDRSLYSNFIEFNDGNIGFSVVRTYPIDVQNILIRKNNDFSDSCRIWVGLILNSEKALYNIYPVHIRITNMKDTQGFTLGENRIQKIKYFRPINFETIREYSYDDRFKSIGNQRGQPLTGNDILGSVFEKHILPCRPIKGYIVRSKTKYLRIGYILLNQTINILKCLLYLISGRKVEKQFTDLLDDAYYQCYGDLLYKIDFNEIVKVNCITAFNSLTTYNSVVSSSIFVLIGAILHQLNIVGSLGGLSNKFYFQAIFWILILFIIDVIFPRVQLLIINLLIQVKRKIFYKITG
jgi:hypothetical protein